MMPKMVDGRILRFQVGRHGSAGVVKAQLVELVIVQCCVGSRCDAIKVLRLVLVVLEVSHQIMPRRRYNSL